MEEHLILDNRYTEHSTVGLAQQWDQLDQLGMRMQHNLEQQIQARNQSGVSEDALKEFSMMFKHFDKDKSGRLNQQEFKSCLRALGYDLPMVEEGQPDPEFEAILGKIYVMCFCALLDIKYKASTTVATRMFYYLHVGCAMVHTVITTLSLQRPVFDPRLICFGKWYWDTSFFLCHCHSSNFPYSFLHKHCWILAIDSIVKEYISLCLCGKFVAR